MADNTNTDDQSAAPAAPANDQTPAPEPTPTPAPEQPVAEPQEEVSRKDFALNVLGDSLSYVAPDWAKVEYRFYATRDWQPANGSLPQLNGYVEARYTSEGRGADIIRKPVVFTISAIEG